MPGPNRIITLSQHHTFAGATVALDADGSVRGVAYSGGVIKRHPKLRNVVIDIASTRFGGTLPMFKNHDPNKEVAAIELAADGRQITFSGDFLDSPEAEQIRKNSTETGRPGKRKFPYAASVGISTETVRELKAGASETINGQRITGPAMIFQNNEITEVSLTPIAADQNNPTAHIFTATNQHQPTQEAPIVTEQTTPPGVTEAQLTALEAKFTAQLATQLSAKDEQIKTLSNALAAMEERERTAKVTALFSTVGIEAKPESIAQYMSLTDAQFTAVSADMTNLAKLKKPAATANLFSATQLPNTDTPAPKTGTEILKAAQTYQFSQKQAGNEIELSEAIRIVTTQES